MSKPPKSPPSSDIGGVDRDRVAVDVPANAKPDPGGTLSNAGKQSKARPDSDDRRA